MENNVIRFTEMSKIATNPKLGLVLEKLPFLKKSFATLSELDKYVGLTEGAGKAPIREDITILFDSKDKGKSIPKRSCLWKAVETRNEAEICKRAMEEVDKLLPSIKSVSSNYQTWLDDPNKKSEDNPLAKAARVISDFCMNNSESKYINYMFLQCTGTIMGAAAGRGLNKADIIHNQFLRERFLKNRGNEGGDVIAEVYLMGYLAFILGKDLFGAVNGTKPYTEQFDNSGLLFDRNNNESRIARIVRELENHPFDDEPDFMPGTRTAPHRKYVKDEKTGERYNKYALDLAKGNMTPDEFKAKIDSGEISMEEAMAAKEDYEEVAKYWSSVEAPRPIQLAGKFAAQQFNNAKAITLKLPSYHVSDTVKMWVTDPTQMVKDKEKLSTEQYIAFLNEYNKYTKDLARALGTENAKSLDDKVAGKDGDDMNFGDTIGEEDANLTGVEDDEELKECFTNVLESLKEVNPKEPGMFRLLVSILSYPQVDTLATAARVAGGWWYNIDTGVAKLSSQQKSMAFSGGQAKWSDGQTWGLFNDYVLENVITIVNNRAYIEKKEDLVVAFDGFIKSLKSLYQSLYHEPLILNNIPKATSKSNFNIWIPRKVPTKKGEVYFMDTPMGIRRSNSSAESSVGYVQVGSKRFKPESIEGIKAIEDGTGKLVTKQVGAIGIDESLFADIYDMSRL